MKKSDLYREWARVMDMCEGTNVSAGLCWTLDGVGRDQDCNPVFSEDPDSYEFAVAILEGNPVFVGDRVYSKICDGMVTVTDQISNHGYYSWNPPKKTFMLNGEELPCPVTTQGGDVMIIKVGNQECHFMFESGKDADKVMTSIYNLLIGSMK